MKQRVNAAGKKNRNRIKMPAGERALYIFISVFLTIFCFTTLYPFVNTIALSFNEGPDAMRGGIYLWPRAFTLMNYERVFNDNTVVRAYGITIARTVLGTITTLVFTGMMAYGPVSYTHLPR